MIGVVIQLLAIVMFTITALMCALTIAIDLYAVRYINHVASQVDDDATPEDRHEVMLARTDALVEADRLHRELHKIDGMCGLGDFAVVKVVLMIASVVSAILYAIGLVL